MEQQKPDANPTDRTPSSQSAATSVPTAPRDEIDAARREEEIDIQRKTLWWTRVIAIAAIALGVLQGFLLYFQTAHTGKAATAAITSATSVMLAERAYVTMLHVEPGIVGGDIATTIARDGQTQLPHRSFKVTVQIKNHGNTPARVTDVALSHYFGRPLPAQPPMPTHDEGAHAFLVKGQTFEHWRDFDVLASDMEAIEADTSDLYILGYVDYIDQFGTRHRSGYAHIFDPTAERSQPFVDRTSGQARLRSTPAEDNLIFVPKPGYNYDRTRERGEGNDWDES